MFAESVWLFQREKYWKIDEENESVYVKMYCLVYDIISNAKRVKKCIAFVFGSSYERNSQSSKARQGLSRVSDGKQNPTITTVTITTIQ